MERSINLSADNLRTGLKTVRPGFKVLGWAVITVMLLISGRSGLLAALTVCLAALTAVTLAGGGRLRPGFGRGLLWMVLLGVSFNLLNSWLRQGISMPGLQDLLGLWRLMLLAWSAVLLNIMLTPLELAELLEGWMRRSRLPLGGLPVIACSALQLLPEIYDQGVIVIRERLSPRRRGLAAAITDVPIVLAELLLFSFARAEALTDTTEIRAAETNCYGT